MIRRQLATVLSSALVFAAVTTVATAAEPVPAPSGIDAVGTVRPSPASEETRPPAPGEVDVDGVPVGSVPATGTWEIELPSAPRKGDLTTQGFSNTYCAGTFIPDPRKVSNSLEWGASQTCTGSYAPQWVDVKLQSTCTGFYCQRFVDETGFRRSNNSSYARVGTYFGSERCDTSGFRKYRVIARSTARGVQFSPVIGPERVVACDISA